MKRIILPLLLLLAFCSAQARRIHVNLAGSAWANGTSWETATNDLSSALSHTSAGDTVWVAVGTYYGGFLMPEGVTVLGGFLGMETHESQRLPIMFSTQRSILNGKTQYRVLQQPADYDQATVWDGFEITGGIGQIGAGALLRKNGILRNCIVRENSAGLPAVGEYLPQEGGLVLSVNSSTKKSVIISRADFGRHFQHTRGKEAVAGCTEGGKTDWRLPSNTEILNLTASTGDGRYAFTPTYYLLENSLKQNGGEAMQGKQYWTSNTVTESGNPVAYCLHTNNAQRGRLSTWGYCRIRPVRSTTLTTQESTGGGVYATSGSTLSGCMVSENHADQDEDIHVQGEVLIIDIDDTARPHFMASLFSNPQ